MDYQKIGRFIAELRREKGITQVKLAELLGVSAKTISRLENGTTPLDLDSLKKLSSILGVSIDEIIDGVRKKKPKEEKRKKTKKYKLVIDNGYVNDKKNNVILCFMLITLILFLLTIILVSRRSCNNCGLYSFEGYDEKYTVNGLVIKSSKGDYVIINYVDSSSNIIHNTKVYDFQYTLYLGGVVLYKDGDIKTYVHHKKNTLESLKTKLNDIRVYVNNPVDDVIQFSFFKQMYLEIHYIDDDLTSKMLVIPIKINKI